jgi:hypothetical protein
LLSAARYAANERDCSYSPLDIGAYAPFVAWLQEGN